MKSIYKKPIYALLTEVTNSQFIRGSVIFTSASFVVSVLHYIFNLLVARGLSLENYGEYSSALSLIAILSVPLTAVNVLIINQLSRTQATDRHALASALEQVLLDRFKRQIALLLTVFFLTGALLYNFTNLGKISIIFILGSVLLQLFVVFYSSVLQAKKAFIIAGSISVSVAVLKLAVGSGILTLMPSIEAIYGMLLLVGLITVSLSKWKLQLNQHEPINRNLSRSLLNYAQRPTVLYPTLTVLGITSLLHLDVVLVKLFFPADLAGAYAGVSLLAKIILYATGPISLVALTFFSDTEHNNNSKKILSFSLFLYLLGGSVLTVIYYVFSNYVVLAVFGSKFLQITEYVWITGILGSLHALAGLLGQYLVSRHSATGVLSIIAAVIQVMGVYFYHNSFYDVLTVSIVVLTFLVSIYSYQIFRYGK